MVLAQMYRRNMPTRVCWRSPIPIISPTPPKPASCIPPPPPPDPPASNAHDRNVHPGSILARTNTVCGSPLARGCPSRNSQSLFRSLGCRCRCGQVRILRSSGGRQGGDRSGRCRRGFGTRLLKGERRRGGVGCRRLRSRRLCLLLRFGGLRSAVSYCIEEASPETEQLQRAGTRPSGA